MKKTTTNSEPKAKVIPIRNTTGVFSQGLRERLEESVSPYTDKPTEAVNSFENALCVFVVSTASALTAKVGELAGKKVAEMLLPKGAL